MKTLSNLLKESVNESRNTLTIETDSDQSKGAACVAFDTRNINKYKHAFLTYNKYQGIFITAFNTIEDIQDLLDTDDDEYSMLLNMKPQDTRVIDNVAYVCMK